MSKIFPPELVEALGLVHDISVGLVSENCYLLRGTLTKSAYDEESMVYNSAPEPLECYIKFPDLPKVHPGSFYDEDEVPLTARIKNVSAVKQGDLILVYLKRLLDRTSEWKRYVVIAPKAKIVSNMEVYSVYILNPDRTARDIWLADGCVSENYDGDLTSLWDIINNDYTLDTAVKHSGTASINGGNIGGALFQSKTVYAGVKFNVWVLFSLTGIFITRFRIASTTNYYELICEKDGLFVKFTLKKIISGVGTIVATSTSTIVVSGWVNITVETVYECTTNKNVIRCYFSDATHTEQVVVEDGIYPAGTAAGGKVQIGVTNGTHMDGESLFCNLFHIE